MRLLQNKITPKITEKKHRVENREEDLDLKSNGKRARSGKRIVVKQQTLGDAFASKQNYTKDYGEKASGGKPRGRFRSEIKWQARKKREKNRSQTTNIR